VGARSGRWGQNGTEKRKKKNCSKGQKKNQKIGNISIFKENKLSTGLSK